MSTKRQVSRDYLKTMKAQNYRFITISHSLDQGRFIHFLESGTPTNVTFSNTCYFKKVKHDRALNHLLFTSATMLSELEIETIKRGIQMDLQTLRDCDMPLRQFAVWIQNPTLSGEEILSNLESSTMKLQTMNRQDDILKMIKLVRSIEPMRVNFSSSGSFRVGAHDVNSIVLYLNDHLSNPTDPLTSNIKVLEDIETLKSCGLMVLGDFCMRVTSPDLIVLTLSED